MTGVGRQRTLNNICLDANQNELAERPKLRSKKETAHIAAGRTYLGSPTWARTWDLRINSPARHTSLFLAKL
jgi:hypothetical protein